MATAVFAGFVLVVSIAVMLSKTTGHLDSSSVARVPLNYSARMSILKNIPLVSGVEKLSSSEDEDTKTLIEIFSKFANHNASPGANGGPATLHRGTHAKGQCFTGQLTVLNDIEMQRLGESILLPRLRQGFLSRVKSYPLTMRFANADGTGHLQNDHTGDVRGLSFAVHGLAGQDFDGSDRQDFMMNSTAAFASGGIHEFLEIVKAANLLSYKDPHYLVNPRYAGAVIGDLKKIEKGNGEGKDIESYATTQYWANLPYTHGSGSSPGGIRDIVKYKAMPCDGRPTQYQLGGTPADPNYLQNDIQARVANGQVCFNLQIQFFDLPALRATAEKEAQKSWELTDWVENGGLLWDETAMPFHTVAQIKAQGPPISCDDQYINTRLHSNPENQPVGSIARVRTFIEETSRARRMGEIR